MNPKHSNPQQKDRVAHAPYNFVPLPESVVLSEGVPRHDAYAFNSGYIDCTVTTESPTYTRAALNPELFKQLADQVDLLARDEAARHEYARFFALDDLERPIIPGSTLRGMIRNLVEIAGYGKMQWVTNEPLAFRAVGDTTSLGDYYRGRLVSDDGERRYSPLVEGGYVVRRGATWFIRPAQTIGGTTFARMHVNRLASLRGGLTKWRPDSKNASGVWVKLGANDYQQVRGGFIRLRFTPVVDASSSPKPGFDEAVLARSGRMPGKMWEAVIFPPDQSAALLEISDQLLRRYRDQITREQLALLGENGVLKHEQPVFFLRENGHLVFFGHAMLFRLPYQRSPLDLIPEPLRESAATDLAEALFGYAPASRDEKRGAYAGRVYVGDAHLEPGQSGVWVSELPITPAILSSPKPTTFQHYLAQWRPDPVETGRRNKDGSPKTELRLGHYASPPPHATAVRGHKLYWHMGPVDLASVREQSVVRWEQDSQHTQIKPVRAGVSFAFRVYFENLRDYELGALLWALTLPGEPNVEYRHKLGMGKPLGMGSAKIAPRLVLTDRDDRYRRLFEGEEWCLGERQGAELDRFIVEFEGYVLKRMDKTERGDASLSGVERIRMLLRMLEWPGPDRDLTRYMQIEGARGNEYKNRPVLPDPLHVNNRPALRSAPSEATQTGRGGRLTTGIAPLAGAAKPLASAPAQPKQRELPAEGERFKGIVRGSSPTGDVLVAVSFLGGEVVGVLEQARLEGSTYRRDDRAWVEVIGHKESDGQIVLLLKKANKRAQR